MAFLGMLTVRKLATIFQALLQKSRTFHHHQPLESSTSKIKKEGKLKMLSLEIQKTPQGKL